jgi:hypothetical protein
MTRKTFDSEAMTGVFGARSVSELEARYAARASTYNAKNAAAGVRLPALRHAAGPFRWPIPHRPPRRRSLVTTDGTRRLG